MICLLVRSEDEPPCRCSVTAWLAGSELLFKQLAGKTAAATSFYQELLLSCFHTQLAVISHTLHLALRQEEVTNDLLVDAGYINHVHITGKSHRDTHAGLITKVIAHKV